MIISPLDRMNYFKGVLLLYLKNIDGRDSQEEYVKKFVDILHFDPAFCEFAMRDIMGNLSAIDEPPDFSGKEVARIFVRDCIKIAFENRIIDPKELDWLHQVAKRNELEEEWFARELFHFLKLKEINTKYALEIEQFM